MPLFLCEFFPLRKCNLPYLRNYPLARYHLYGRPGVRAAIPSPLLARGTKSLLFIQASTCVRTVEYSSNVSFKTLSQMNSFAFDSCFHRPPKCGARSGINDHLMFWKVQNSEIFAWVFICCKKEANLRNSQLAPTKLVPWSLQISEGFPWSSETSYKGLTCHIWHKFKMNSLYW